MAIQSFSVGQVLTAAQVNALQANDYNQTVNAKTASYTLVAADKGTRITMSSTSATTITVNTSLFSAGDTLFIQNLNTGVTTITAGTATVTTASSLALAQWEGGTLYFTSASAAIFFKSDGAAAGGGGKVLQVVQGTTTTTTTITSTTYSDTTLTASITPSSATSKVLVMYTQQVRITGVQKYQGVGVKLLRGSTVISDNSSTRQSDFLDFNISGTMSEFNKYVLINTVFLDSPATTSATTYKTQGATNVSGSSVIFQDIGAGAQSNIILMEIGA